MPDVEFEMLAIVQVNLLVLPNKHTTHNPHIYREIKQTNLACCAHEFVGIQHYVFRLFYYVTH